MKAKKKPIEKITPEDLNVDLTPLLEVLKFQEPPKRVGGGKVSSFTTQPGQNIELLVVLGCKCGRASCKVERCWYQGCINKLNH